MRLFLFMADKFSKLSKGGKEKELTRIFGKDTMKYDKEARAKHSKSLSAKSKALRA